MASALSDEISENFNLFETQWPIELTAAQTALSVSTADFKKSFTRISSIQAWRVHVIIPALNPDAEAFFFEAQNDLLTSHCLARCGSFRQALKALRSASENILYALYYKDHPVEFEKWEMGQHKLGFSEMLSYFESHPKMSGISIELTGLDILRTEYSTLSKAVHGSAKSFRMTQNLNDIRLWDDDVASVGKWATRERILIQALNFLLLVLLREHLAGAANRNLRETIGLIVPKAKFSTIKTCLGITLIP